MIKLPIKIDEAEYNYMRENYMGYCLACGEQRDSCEPDAENYKCEECGARKVFGIENLMIMGSLDIIFQE